MGEGSIPLSIEIEVGVICFYFPTNSGLIDFHLQEGPFVVPTEYSTVVNAGPEIRQKQWWGALQDFSEFS